MRRFLLVLLTLVLGVAGGMALAVAADVRTFPGVDARRTAAEPAATATVTATATATATVTATPSGTPTPSGSASASPTTEPTPTATATPTAAPVPTDGPVRLTVAKEGSFVVRSGPVTCYLLNYFGDRSAECTVSKQQFAEPKRPASCEYDWAPQFTLRLKATYGQCRSDVNDRDSTTRLKAGERAVNGPIACVATAGGIECRHADTGRGFTVSRASYRVF